MIRITDTRYRFVCPRCRRVGSGFQFHAEPSGRPELLCLKCFCWRLWDVLIAVKVTRNHRGD